MDALHQAALEGLNEAFTGLFPEGEAPLFSSLPRKIGLTGIGGLIGKTEAPAIPGELFGRRVEGDIAVFVQAADPTSLSAAAASVMTSVLAHGRTELSAAGFLKLSQDRLDEVRQTAPDVLSQTVFFKVLFEYRHLPESEGDRIDTIPVNLNQDGEAENFEITPPESP